MRHVNILNFLSIVFVLLLQNTWANTYKVNQIASLSINSAITPATLDYLTHQFQNIPKDSLAILKINTPGGLITTTKDIITLIGKQDYPVAVWIMPEGASASSAGAIIASSAHFIFMAPGTNIGAATPVGLGEDIAKGDGRSKVINDLTSLVRSLSESRGRPSAPFEDMIKTAGSYTDKEALKLKIIDGVVSKSEEIITLIEGKAFRLKGQEYTIRFSPNAPSQELEPTAGQKILEVLANPSTAYFLFLIGLALLYFEFQAPGGFIAGSVGLGFLILAAISFQVLPLNWGALGLIILGVVFFIMEIFVTSYGILTLAGLASFIMGSLFLFHGEAGFISVEYPVILSTLAGVFASVAFIVWYLINDQKKQGKINDFFIPNGEKGIIVTKLSPTEYQVKVRGEIWKGNSKDDLTIGDPIEVIGVDPEHLIIHIKKANKEL